jgi:chromosome segregation ATPase
MALQEIESSSTEEEGVLEMTPTLKKQIQAAARRLLEIKEERNELTAEKRSLLEKLVADKVSREAIERAVKDAERDPDKLERQDFWYTHTRAALGKPIQRELFPTVH